MATIVRLGQARGRLTRTKLRSIADYATFVFRYRLGFRIALLTFGISVASFAAAPVGPSLFLTALGAASFTLAVLEYWRQVRAMTGLAVFPSPLDFSRIVPPPNYEVVTQTKPGAAPDYALSAKKPLLLRSGLVGDRRQVLAEISPGAYQIPGELKSTAAGVLFGHYRRSNAPHFNGGVVRQSAELIPEKVLRLGRASYFDLLSTNYLVGKRVCASDGECLVEGASFLLAGDATTVTSLTDSWLANPIGVSSLALTADDPPRLLLVRQSVRSASSAGQWAPSSSGSVDDRDVAGIEPQEQFAFVDMLTRAMERELAEECNILPADIVGTRVTGTYRWLNKGGKPEYTAVTLLGVTEDELSMRPRGEEKFWVSRLVAVRGMKYSSLVGEDVLASLPDASSGTALGPLYFRRDASFPLYMCLRALGSELRRDTGLRGWLRL